jgi:hypothetical protein
MIAEPTTQKPLSSNNSDGSRVYPHDETGIGEALLEALRRLERNLVRYSELCTRIANLEKAIARPSAPPKSGLAIAPLP